MKRIAVSEFKAKCLALVDEVAQSGEPIEILKRGRPVARVVPSVDSDGAEFPQQSLKGTVETLGDIIRPVVPEDAWGAYDE